VLFKNVLNSETQISMVKKCYLTDLVQVICDMCQSVCDHGACCRPSTIYQYFTDSCWLPCH